MIYVYAIADRPQEPLPGQLGQHGEALAKIVWRDVAAVVSAFDGLQLSNSGDELWRHEEVVEALMSDRAVVPVRFGTLVSSPQRVSDVLCRAYGALVQDIEQVRGQVEIGMRFLSATENGAADDRPLAACNGLALSGTGPGHAYLRSRLVRERELRDRQRARLERVRGAYEQLAGHATASRLDDKPDDRRGASAAFLVPRDRLGCFREIVGGVANAHPELALLCTGPWPAYSFVNAGENPANWSDGHAE